MTEALCAKPASVRLEPDARPAHDRRTTRPVPRGRVTLLAGEAAIHSAGG
jgi:hypothetical protein